VPGDGAQAPEDLSSRSFYESAAADGYYAVLYAARTALSEEERYAKTHGGTWDLFYRLFVGDGRFDRELYAEARSSERIRLDAHYEAREVPFEEARRVVDAAERFVSAVERMVSR
jgi:uncharacterized protein (UPF0332 family)